jgi:hypothetical protein
MKYGKKLKLGDAISPKEITNKYKRKIMGMPHGTPSSSTKFLGHLSRHHIFIASYAMCCSWSIFIFYFSFIV